MNTKYFALLLAVFTCISFVDVAGAESPEEEKPPKQAGDVPGQPKWQIYFALNMQFLGL